MDILHSVIKYADESHGTQLRRYSQERYIVHPIRVMESCKKYTADLPMLSAAILHDVLEDTPVTRQDMQEFLRRIMTVQEADRTLQLVVELTDVYVKANYPRMNRAERKEKERTRLSRVSADAQTIKYADVLDNAVDIVQNDPDFSTKFLEEGRLLLEVMTNGDSHLREVVIQYLDSTLKTKSSRQKS